MAVFDDTPWSLSSDHGMSYFPPIPRRFAEYEILQALGRGGMGEVYLALHTTLRRRVALKVLSPHLADKPDAVERFVREARAASKIDHPSIVAIYEAGVREGRPFIAMRYVEGATLAEKVAQARDLSEKRPVRAGDPDPAASVCGWRGKGGLLELLGLFERLARALHVAHEAGLVHRDVKPANILLSLEGEPVLVDFGLARLCEQDLPSLTNPGEMVGTPAYMAPEQIRYDSWKTDRRADVYGLGVTLYECLTLRRPFDARVPSALYRAILTEEPPDPRRFNPAIPRELCTVLLKTLEKDPARRYPSALALAEDLRRLRAHEPILARPPGALLKLRRWTQRNPVTTTAISMLTVGLVLTSALLYGLWRERGKKESALDAMRTERDAKAVALQRADALRLAASSTLRLPASPTLAMQLAQASVRSASTLEGRNAVLAALEACHEILVLRGHTNTIHDAAFSPDCERIATASSDGTVRLWSTATGAALAVLRPHDRSITSVRFDETGRRLVTTSRDETARLSDAETGEVLARLPAHAGPFESAAFNPRGRTILTVSVDGTAAIWDATSLSLLVTLDGHAARVRAADFSPDGEQVATASDDATCKIWTTRDGSLVQTLSGHTGRVVAVSFDPTGTQVITASADKTARIWDLWGRWQPLTLVGHSAALTGAVFSPDGERAATCSQDLTARVWHVDSGLTRAVLRGHDDSVTSIAFSPDGNSLLTTSHDRTARLWGISKALASPALPSSSPERLRPAFSRDGQRVALCLPTGDVEVWDLVSSKKLAILAGHGADVPYVAFDAGGRRLVSCCRDTIGRIWDVERGELLVRLVGHTEGILEARFSCDGRLVVTASRDATARVWDAASGQQLGCIAGNTNTVYSALLGRDGRIVMTGCRDGTARSWDASTGQPLRVFTGHEGPVYSVAMSPDGERLLTVSWDSTARVWDLHTGAEVLILRGHQGQGRTGAFSPDGTQIVTEADDGTARLWNARTGQEILTIGGQGHWVDGATFTARGEEVLTLSREGRLLRSPIDPVSAAAAMRLRSLTPDERDHHEVGTAEERQRYRQAWELKRRLTDWRSGAGAAASPDPCRDLERIEAGISLELESLFRSEGMTLRDWVAAAASKRSP